MERLDIHGVRVQLTSDSPSFSDFVKDGLGFFHKDAAAAKEPPLFSIDVHVAWDEAVSAREYLSGFEKIGNQAYIKDDAYVCLLGHHVMEFRKVPGGLVIRLMGAKPESFYGKSKQKLRRLLYGRDDYFVLRHAIILPVLYALSKHAGIYAMHGAGFNLDGKGVALAGLAGVGKSTLVLGATLQCNAGFLADNYLLFDREKFYPFPEWIRLYPKTERLLANSSRKLEPTPLRRYGRSYFHLPKGFVSGPVASRSVIFPRLADKMAVRPLNVTTALDRILLSNNHVREFPEHSLSGLVDFLYGTEASVHESMTAALRSLLEKSVRYDVSLEKDKPIADMVRAVASLS